MRGFLYGAGLQFRLDMRSKSLFITCYLVPLVFFAVMGGIFTAVMPESRTTLVSSMTVLGVSMGALIGVPPSLAEIYGTGVKRMYQAGGARMWSGLAFILTSAWFHLLIMSGILLVAAPAAFSAPLPPDLGLHFLKVFILIGTTLAVAGVPGLWVREQAKLTMICQLLFLPSIMLSGIFFPSELLPPVLEKAGRLFPAWWGYRLLTAEGMDWKLLVPMAVLFAAGAAGCFAGLKRRERE